jgi:hypothetical protein
MAVTANHKILAFLRLAAYCFQLTFSKAFTAKSKHSLLYILNVSMVS